MSPVSQSDGHDEPRLIRELVPRRAAVIEDVVVGGEDPVGDPVLAQELPDVLDGVQLRRLSRELPAVSLDTVLFREAGGQTAWKVMERR